MTETEPIFEDVAVPALQGNGDPTKMVVHGRWFYPVTLLVPVVAFAVGYVLSTGSPTAPLMFAIIGSLMGLMMTMVAMAWGSAIAFTVGTRSGLLFTIFPPYMPYFAATRWRWMAQPSVLFLAGLALAIATLWATKRMIPPPPAVSCYDAADKRSGFSAVMRTQTQPLTVV